MIWNQLLIIVSKHRFPVSFNQGVPPDERTFSASSSFPHQVINPQVRSLFEKGITEAASPSPWGPAALRTQAVNGPKISPVPSIVTAPPRSLPNGRPFICPLPSAPIYLIGRSGEEVMTAPSRPQISPLWPPRRAARPTCLISTFLFFSGVPP